MIHSCHAAIDRVKTGASVSYASIVSAGTPYTDTSFPSSDWIIWNDYNSHKMNYITVTSVTAARGSVIFVSPVLYDATPSTTLYNNVA